MKAFKYILVALFSAALFSCSQQTPAPSETVGLTKVQEFTNDDHIVELYTKNGSLETGYNDIYLRIKSKASGEYFTEADIMWMPVMHMMSMNHSCPYSAVTKVAGKETLFNGNIVFQMPENADEGWTLTIDYMIMGTNYTAAGDISVPDAPKKRVMSFMGSDAARYIVALIAPSDPKVAINDMSVGVYKMESMMSFPKVADYKLLIDPRMPGMGNHGSPNNEDPVYSDLDGLYHGKLSLTMTGYWKINMILKNAADEVLKGEEVTESVESSSLYFEVEF